MEVIEISTPEASGVSKMLTLNLSNPCSENMTLTPEEYRLIVSTKSFILYGAEDKDLYKKSAQLWHEFASLRDYFHKKEFWNMSESELQRELDNAPQELTQKMYAFYAKEEDASVWYLRELAQQDAKGAATL